MIEFRKLTREQYEAYEFPPCDQMVLSATKDTYIAHESGVDVGFMECTHYGGDDGCYVKMYVTFDEFQGQGFCSKSAETIKNDNVAVVTYTESEKIITAITNREYSKVEGDHRYCFNESKANI
jgi:hypothetical protein